jgi:hypothetical protein
MDDYPVTSIDSEPNNDSQEHAEPPILSVPTETLAYILFFMVRFGHSPRTLARVCRRWYHIAINSPFLWSDIFIVARRADAFSTPLLDRSQSRRELCAHIDELEQTLSRAKKAPLMVSINCTDATFSKIGRPSFTQLFNRLFSPQITPQIVTLNIEPGNY